MPGRVAGFGQMEPAALGSSAEQPAFEAEAGALDQAERDPIPRTGETEGGEVLGVGGAGRPTPVHPSPTLPLSLLSLRPLPSFSPEPQALRDG